MKDKLYVLFFIIISFNSCDILRRSQFEIISWTPGNGYHSKPEEIAVTLNFSRDPDKASVERNFSLTGNGNRIKGTFLWNGRKMIFTPIIPLEINTDYVILVSADAHDEKGLSMDEAFTSDFTTRPDNKRPVLISCYPEMYSSVSDPRTEIKLLFSIPVLLSTLYENISFNPSMTGSWRLEDSGKSAIFSPAEPWTQNKKYEIRYTALLTDKNGMNIGNDFLSVFTVGTDHEAPFLLYAKRISKNGDAFTLNAGGFIGAAELSVENNDWEKDDKLLLVFSKPVDSLMVKNYLNVENASGLVMENSSLITDGKGYSAEFIFKFDTIPVYGSRFTFRLKPGVKDLSGNESKDEYVYRIFADGKKSKPPVLKGFRMSMTPGKSAQNFFYAGTDSIFKLIPIADENYPSGENVQTWIEFYFDTAEGTYGEKASIDVFSLMELFRIETSNNVITFYPRQVKTSNFSVSAPHTEWESFVRLEIAGNIVNSTNYGIIIFHIGAGLKDSFGNKNENPQKISLVK
ncbi:MAG: Ig-like domain-containing protein [Spirochaetes bacterium]|nr:Ig-like domain-containing protein [Spirochaetota bacterium]